MKYRRQKIIVPKRFRYLVNYMYTTSWIEGFGNINYKARKKIVTKSDVLKLNNYINTGIRKHLQTDNIECNILNFYSNK